MGTTEKEMKDLKKEIENIAKCFFINYGERSPEIVFNETKLLKVITGVKQDERKKTLEEVGSFLLRSKCCRVSVSEAEEFPFFERCQLDEPHYHCMRCNKKCDVFVLNELLKSKGG